MNSPSSSASSSITLKRARSSTAAHPTRTPDLPKITNVELFLQVFTHRSLRRATSRNAPEDYGDNERLYTLGKMVLNVAVTHALFHKRPMLKTSEICVRRDEILSDAIFEDWVSIYGLREKLRCHPEVIPTLKLPEETRAIFCSYVGGLFADRGMEVVQGWIGQLLQEVHGVPPEPSQPVPRPYIDTPPQKRVKSEDLSASNTSEVIFFGSQPPPSPPSYIPLRPRPPHSHSPLPNPLAPAQPNLPFLPLFNQTAAQRHVTVAYPAEFSGPPHAGRWKVQCVVNGILKGVGTGASKQIAKEEAARQAYYAMGWT